MDKNSSALNQLICFSLPLFGADDLLETDTHREGCAISALMFCLLLFFLFPFLTPWSSCQNLHDFCPFVNCILMVLNVILGSLHDMNWDISCSKKITNHSC